MLARYQHVVALLWFHLLNHIRRIVATYIFPIIIIGLGALLLLLYSQNKTNVKDTLDDGVYDSDFSIAYNRGDVCPGFSVKLENFSEKNVNGTLQVGITDRYGDFSVEATINFEQSNWLVGVNTKLCDLLDKDTNLQVKSPMLSLSNKRYVFSKWDTFSFSVFLFYCIVLSELHQDKIRRTDEFLWSLGVSSFEKMVSWYISIILQAMLWSAINFVQFAPQILDFETNIVFLWFLYSLVFFSTAIWAFVTSKFVKGTLSYILAVMHMLLFWLFVVIYFFIAEQPLPQSKALRYLLLVHPIPQSVNIFKLATAAEFSKLGLKVSTLTSFFGMPTDWFFGNGLETFLLMFLSSLACTILFLINFEYLYQQLLSLVKSKAFVNTDFDCAAAAKVEAVRNEFGPLVEVQNLSKVYPNGFQAVSNVSFSIYPGEMIGLLGKNGAGKSTTMNVIAGFHEATAGKVLVNGIDISTNRNEAIGTLSFCPQEDRFFFRLTVLEHLKFVCMLKGTKYDSSRAMQLLKELGIEQKSGAKPRNISGGQKRRVCIAMAYVANSPLIILDEPTSAVDAATRKTLWSFFQNKQKENPEQAVILCTHFMQEADVLSQRIAIISDGILRAFGSSAYLKGLFGVGYTVSFSSEHYREVEKIVRGALNQETKFREVSETESAFQVPMEYSSMLCSVLAELEKRNIVYNFNASTLENVFVVLSTSPDLADHGRQQRDDSADGVINGSCDTVEEASEMISPREKPKDIFFLLEAFFLQFKFSILVDFIRLFRKNWTFFLGYTIVFFLLPQLVLLLCQIDSLIEDSNPLDDGNVTINMYSINKNPKVAVLGNVSVEKLEELRAAIGDPAIHFDAQYTEEDFLNAYLNHPMNFYDKYPFMVSYDRNSEKFRCVVNSNFDSSESLCKMAMINLYNTETGNRVNVEMKLFRDEDFYEYSYYWNNDDDDKDRPSNRDICRGSIYYYLVPVIYFCLLFHILRLEAQRNEMGLSPFYIANGANPMYSLFNRIAGLIIIILVYLIAFVILGHLAGYGFAFTNNHAMAPALSGKNIAYFFLFAISFACFAILFGKLTGTVVLLLLVTAISGVLYMIFFGVKTYRVSALKVSKWFCLLVYPGYILPVGSFGMLYSYETKESDKEILVSLCVQIAVYLLLIVLTESLALRFLINAISKLIGRGTYRPMTSPDDDVAVFVHDVSHTYFSMELEIPCCCCCKSKNQKCSVFKLTRALKGMSIQVPKNTCYALLGVNGAGKSTMFEILTGGNRLQKGHVSILNNSLLWKPLTILKDIGYCSQKDKIPGYLTGNTILHLFGQLRGLSDDVIETQKEYMVEVMDVGSHMDKLISGCSGGTKRKISTMVAFIGFPKIIILDESTTGVDPITRMNFGKLIRTAKRNGSTIIISSHTMEECESAADSICIMTRGRKHCEGTAEELKSQYGKFYTVTIKVHEQARTAEGQKVLSYDSRATDAPNKLQVNLTGEDRPDAPPSSSSQEYPPVYSTPGSSFAPPPYVAPPSTENLSSLLMQQFEGAELQYSFTAGLFRHLFFNIPKQNTSLSALFSRLDAMKRQNLFAECIVSTASLEHIFMQIAMEDEYAKNNPTAATGNH